MTDFEKDEFSKGLTRLYDSVLELRATAERDGENIRRLEATARQDGENIRALARIADIHERRLTALEGGEQQ